MKKRAHGIYYTQGDPFANRAFLNWAKMAGLPKAEIVEPFAGKNSLINMLIDKQLCRHFTSFDILPGAHGVRKRDTLKSFPSGFPVCVTNPPWLAKNSATNRGLAYPNTQYDDIYKMALEKCLAHCDWVAALVPESFIRSGLFHNRLSNFVSLTGKMFTDTAHPVGLALFNKEPSRDVTIWQNNLRIGQLSELEKTRIMPKNDGVKIRFNADDGNVGLIALDNTIEASIRFCDVRELENYEVKPSGRAITKLNVSGHVRIDAWNECLRSFRNATKDIFMTSYRGLRKDGMYRRRCDWSLARGVIHHVG